LQHHPYFFISRGFKKDSRIPRDSNSSLRYNSTADNIDYGLRVFIAQLVVQREADDALRKFLRHRQVRYRGRRQSAVRRKRAYKRVKIPPAVNPARL
jgi:hypothetical protein